MRVTTYAQVIVAAILVCILCPVCVELLWLPLNTLSSFLGFCSVPFSCDALFSFFGVIATISVSVIVARREIIAREQEKKDAIKNIEDEKERCVPAFEPRCEFIDGCVVMTLFNANEFDFYCLEYSDGVTEYLMKGKLSKNSEFKFAIGDVEVLAPFIDDSCPVFPEQAFDRKENGSLSVLLFCRDKFRRLWMLEYDISSNGLIKSETPEILPS